VSHTILLQACFTIAKASGKISSRVSHLVSLSLNSGVFALISSSVNDSNLSYRSLILFTIGRNVLICF
jgi:hypothetical protein